MLSRFRFGAGILIAALTAGLAMVSFGAKAQALSGSDWQAGRIIDDYLFYDGTTLSASSIQSFLNTKVPACDTNGSQPSDYSGGTDYNHDGKVTRAEYARTVGWQSPPYTCLKAYKAKIPNFAANAYCSAIAGTGTTTKPAAYIIYRVARACSIDPKVLIVTLQKEQALVTDTWPLNSQYIKAMGYYCPDSALSSTVDKNHNGCYDSYEGFVKQIYYAARQFRLYELRPDDYNFQAGITANIRYSPKSGCGSSPVALKTKATAGLYNYTPYQPNSAALSNLNGSGNSCSSFGNRNFWRDYRVWFGTTTANTNKDQVISGDWDRSVTYRGQYSPAVKRGVYFFFDNNQDGSLDSSFKVGRSSDVPLAGDWDGDGDKSIGLRRGNWYYLLDSSGNVQKSFKFGNSTDGVFAGNWSGSNEGLGLKRGRCYYLDYFNDGSPNKKICEGQATDSVIVGDWNGDGKDTIGLRRGNIYYLDYDNNGSPNIRLGMGRTTDRVMVGDWNGDGRDSLGLRRVYQSHYNMFFFDNNNNGNADINFHAGRSGDALVIGDWNKDGSDSIGLKRGSDYFLFNSDGSNYKSYVYNY